MENKNTFGGFIQQKRKEKNLTQRELAEKLYVTESAVSKWERGLSYPDITLVTPICAELGLSERELLTSSEDTAQRRLERQVASLRKLTKNYSRISYIIYGLTLLICLICNLAGQSTTPWFLIVLASVAVAFSITNVPVLTAQTGRTGFWTLGSLYASVTFLLLICNLTGGSGHPWFLVFFPAFTLGFSAVFLPFILRGIELPQPISKHKTLAYFTVNTLLLFILMLIVYAYEEKLPVFASVALPVALFCLALPWGMMLIIRYAKMNGWFKTAGCLVLFGLYGFLTNAVLNALLDKVPFALPSMNISVWNDHTINSNLNWIIFLASLALAVLFAAVGVVWRGRRKAD